MQIRLVEDEGELTEPLSIKLIRVSSIHLVECGLDEN